MLPALACSWVGCATGGSRPSAKSRNDPVPPPSQQPDGEPVGGPVEPHGGVDSALDDGERSPVGIIRSTLGPQWVRRAGGAGGRAGQAVCQ